METTITCTLNPKPGLIDLDVLFLQISVSELVVDSLLRGCRIRKSQIDDTQGPL